VCYGMTGHELKVRRVAAKVKAIDLASHMEVAPSRISQIEALADVTPDTEARYLAALADSEVATSVRPRPSIVAKDVTA
jgi:hypothetical protein